MYTSLAISLLVHGILLSWALISFNATPPLKMPEVRPVEVAMISEDDLTRLRKGDRNSKKLETKQVILHSFAHLGESKSEPDFADALIEEVAARLREREYDIHIVPYGKFYEFKMHVKGPSLAKVFKQF